MKFDASGKRLSRTTKEPPEKPFAARFIGKDPTGKVVSVSPPGVFYCRKCGYLLKTYNLNLVGSGVMNDRLGHKEPWGKLRRLHEVDDVHVRLDSDLGWDRVVAGPD